MSGLGKFMGEPISKFVIGDTEVTLLGTAHVSKVSVDAVNEMIDSGEYDGVAIELCDNRYKILKDPNSLKDMDLFEVIRKKKMASVAANLVLGSYQHRIAEVLGVEPGSEMKAAINGAERIGAKLFLIDRDISVTLKRVYYNLTWLRRAYLVAGMASSVLSSEKVDDKAIERLKEGDMLESAFSEFYEKARDVYEPLISERDTYMSAKIVEALKAADVKKLLVVVGAGHLKGMTERLSSADFSAKGEVDRLSSVPAPPLFARLFPWIIVSAIVLSFGVGFLRGAEVGADALIDFILMSGGFSAVGAMIAAAHPLTVIAAFIGAPFAAINPAIGTGMIAAAAELYVRRPLVSDFATVRHDVVRLSGWWKNSVARVFLIFMTSSIGAAIGIYLGGFRLLSSVFGA